MFSSENFIKTLQSLHDCDCQPVGKKVASFGFSGVSLCTIIDVIVRAENGDNVSTEFDSLIMPKKGFVP